MAMRICWWSTSTASRIRCRNDGKFFSDATVAAGLRSVSRPFTRFGTAWIDFDNDGWLDLYQANGRVGQQAERYGDDPYTEPSLLYKGSSTGRFEEVRPRGGTAALLTASSRAAALAISTTTAASTSSSSTATTRPMCCATSRRHEASG